MAAKWIYALLDGENRPRYVGVSKDPATRARLHFGQRFKRNTPVARWLRTLELKPDCWLIEEVPAEQAYEAETYWIRLLRQVPGVELLNQVASHGDVWRGQHLPAEMRAKISASLLGKRHDGYLHGERIHTHKLTEGQVLAIKQAPGTARSIAEQFGISHVTVVNIKNGNAWKQLPS